VSVIERLDPLGAWDRLDPILASRRASNAVSPDSLEPLFSAFAELLTIDDADAIVQRAVELARDRVGLVRASIYLATEGRDFMLGTWSSDSSGAILDEHQVVCQVSSSDLETVLAEDEADAYTVFRDYLIVEHRRGGTSVGRRGWITCTPIRCGEGFIGMMLNDAGVSHAPLDRTKQAELVVLCFLLGTTLASLAATRDLRLHHVLMTAVAMLLRDPGVGRHKIARRLGIGTQRMTRMFESGLRVSLPDYRNRLRLDRFALLVANGATSLRDAAVAAGFKSHVQCQQVSRAFRWMAYLKRLAP
jgi:AraC-like DNA-binding protein